MAGRWNKSKTATAGGTKNRLRPGTYLLLIAAFKEAKARKGTEYAVGEMTVVEVMSEQTGEYTTKGGSPQTVSSNPKGDRVSEMFWFDEGDDLYDLTLGRFKNFCCSAMGITESDANELDDDEWETEVEGLFGRGADADPAVGKYILAVVTKETVKAGTHNYCQTTFEPSDYEAPAAA